MKNMPKEFNTFCLDRKITWGSKKYHIAKDAWNEAINIASEVIGEMEGVDYNIFDDYTVVEEEN